MLVHLFVKFDDIEKYNNGEEITATDQSGKSVIFRHHDNLVSVSVPSTEIIEKVDIVSMGMARGNFNRFTIKRLP